MSEEKGELRGGAIGIIVLLICLLYLGITGISYNYLTPRCNAEAAGLGAMLWPVVIPIVISADISEEWFKEKQE